MLIRSKFILSCRLITSVYRVSLVAEIWELQFNNPLCKCNLPSTRLQWGKRGVRIKKGRVG